VEELFQEPDARAKGNRKEPRGEQLRFVLPSDGEINRVGIFKAPVVRRKIDICQIGIIEIRGKKRDKNRD